jgi:hypothetical protein
VVDWESISTAVRQSLPPDAFNTVVAGAAGAFFGALGAQVITSRGQAKQAIVAELNSVSAALSLCFVICNRFISLKKQFIRPMRDQYEQTQKHYCASRNAFHRAVFELHADLQTILPTKVPTQALERYVFERISIRGRALPVASEVFSAIDSLNNCLNIRNSLVDDIQRASLPPKELAERYLGLTNASGVRDEKFKTNIAAIYNQTDDCIFFTRTLADDLLDYGTRLRWRNAWKFRRLPRVGSVDWSEAEADGLMPPSKEYENWLKGFKKKKSATSRFTEWASSLWPWGARQPL